MDEAVLVEVRKRTADRLHDGGDAVLVQPLHGGDTLTSISAWMSMWQHSWWLQSNMQRVLPWLTLGLQRRMMSDAAPPET